jgi:hypothetical protein
MKLVVTFAIVVALAVLSFCAEACPAPDAAAATCPTHHRSDCCDHQKPKADSINPAATLTSPAVTAVLPSPPLVLIAFDLHFAFSAQSESPEIPRLSVLRI